MSELNTYSISTEDGVILKEGDAAFNYYDMFPGIIGKIGYDGWFDFKGEDKTALLNGQRICSVGFAQKKGWM